MPEVAELLAAHEEHRWVEVAPCVYCDDCNIRLYQGTLPERKDPGRAARQAACDHEWDAERGFGFYVLCVNCGYQEWTE
jgi:hypothetical protein